MSEIRRLTYNGRHFAQWMRWLTAHPGLIRWSLCFPDGHTDNALRLGFVEVRSDRVHVTESGILYGLDYSQPI